MTETQLIEFVEKELDQNNEHLNACVYLDEVFEKYQNLRVTFKKNHKKYYNKLLELCSQLNGIIIKTNPATYETIVRVSNNAAPEKKEMISLAEWAKLNGINPATARQRAGRGAFATAKKIGRNWIIDRDERLIDHRVKKHDLEG